MKKLLFIIAMAGFILSCNSEIDDQENNNPVPLDKPVIMKVYCQSNPDAYYQEVKYEYDNDHLISETVYIGGEIDSRKTFEYYANGQLKREIYKITSLTTQEKEYFYNEKNLLEKIIYTVINFNIAGEETDRRQSEETYEYKNDLLVKMVENWGGWNIYEYDEKGKMITLTDYTKLGQKYHITHFKYKGNLKIEEWCEVAETGVVLYLHKFEYNNANQLVTVTENGKTIEKNTYGGNKLLEKQTFYFGIDPGFSFCSGNYIYKYEY